MPKLSPTHYAITDLVETPHRERFGDYESPKDGKGKVFEEIKQRKVLEKLFTDTTERSDDMKQQIKDMITDSEIKDDILKVLDNPTTLAEFKKLITDHKTNINHIITGYAKLGPVLRVEHRISKLYDQIKAIKMEFAIDGKDFRKGSNRVHRKVHAIEEQIEKLESLLSPNKKDGLLRTKEIVAAYELRKIARYASELASPSGMVTTPSLTKMQRNLDEWIMSGQMVLLSGPVGTGKTKQEKQSYIDILQAKYKSGKITESEYKTLRAPMLYNGNEESSIRDLQTKPVQMSNKTDTEEAFVYDEGYITLCLKHNLPLIIDEANRTPPNFLSSLKKFFSYDAGDRYKDPITGESFELQGPLKVMMTANEGGRYNKDTSNFQDQIERELLREYVGYLPAHELYDIFKAKLYLHPGVAHVAPRDLSETLPNLVNAACEINQLYTEQTEFDLGNNKKLKLKSAVLDTKRLLSLVDRFRIGSQETFRGELNANIVDHIARIRDTDDRLIFCHIFSAKGLLCTENIPDLMKGTSLKMTDLSMIKSKKTKVDTITDERLIDPRQLAIGYPGLDRTDSEYKKFKLVDIVGTGRPSHRLHNFRDLDFTNQGTVIKGLMTRINALNLFNPLKNREITSLISKLQQHPDQLADGDLNTIADAIAHTDMSKWLLDDFQTKPGSFLELIDELATIDPRIAKENLKSQVDRNKKKAMDEMDHNQRKQQFDELMIQAGEKITLHQYDAAISLYDQMSVLNIDNDLVNKQQEETKRKKEEAKDPNISNPSSYALPTKTTVQSYQEMKDNPKEKTYPKYAKWLFTQAGNSLGLEFVYPPNRDEIQKGTVDGDKIVRALNTPKNKQILNKLNEIIGLSGVIPIGLDNENQVIYANVRSSGFYRGDGGFNDCLVPSNEIDIPADVITHLTERNKTLVNNNNGLDATDLAALTTRPGLKLRQVNGIKIITIPGYGEIASSTKADTSYGDMDLGSGTTKVRSIDNLKQSKKRRDFITTIPGAEMMTNDEFFRLCNVVAKRMGITQHFDKAYLEGIFSNYKKRNIPFDHVPGRVLRGLSVLLGSGYVHPLDVKGSVVRSAGCTHRFACLFNDEDDYYRIVSPPLKIRSS